MARIFRLDTNFKWTVWLNEDFCRQTDNRNEDGKVLFYNEFAKVYQLLVASSTSENSEKLKSILESFQEPRKRIAVLVAHGFSDSTGWEYQDGEFKQVQSWVDQLDPRKYSCALIGACNPGRIEVHSQTTPLIYAKGNLGFLESYSSVVFNPRLNSTQEYFRR